MRDRLESLEQFVRSYPEGHDTRVLLENLHLDRALRAVEEDIRTLRDALIYPAAPSKPPRLRDPGIYAVGRVGVSGRLMSQV